MIGLSLRGWCIAQERSSVLRSRRLSRNRAADCALLHAKTRLIREAEATTWGLLSPMEQHVSCLGRVRLCAVLPISEGGSALVVFYSQVSLPFKW